MDSEPIQPPSPEGDQAYVRQLPQGLWTSGICDCFQEPRICVQTCICPCVTYGQNTEIVTRGLQPCVTSALIHLAVGVVIGGWIFGCTNRAILREHFALPDEPCSDCVTHFFCSICAICQESRELLNRGADPSLGWVGNVDKWTQSRMTPPIVVPGMNR